MRTRNTVTISLPPAMLRSVERVRKAENRTMSELFREMIRVYENRRSTYTPTSAEKRAIDVGRKSASMSIEDFFTHVERLSKKGSRQERRPRARKRA
jgi:metal-responsive CopG/Arc/MetJ family transcriptional regulator